jgi:hypothetical protein
MKTFCRLPTVIGDCVLISGEVPWPVGDENAGVAERELLNDTEKRNNLAILRKNVFGNLNLLKHFT